MRRKKGFNPSSGMMNVWANAAASAVATKPLFQSLVWDDECLGRIRKKQIGKPPMFQSLVWDDECLGGAILYCYALLPGFNPSSGMMNVWAGEGEARGSGVPVFQSLVWDDECLGKRAHSKPNRASRFQSLVWDDECLGCKISSAAARRQGGFNPSSGMMNVWAWPASRLPLRMVFEFQSLVWDDECLGLELLICFSLVVGVSIPRLG